MVALASLKKRKPRPVRQPVCPTPALPSFSGKPVCCAVWHSGFSVKLAVNGKTAMPIPYLIGIRVFPEGVKKSPTNTNL